MQSRMPARRLAGDGRPGMIETVAKDDEDNLLVARTHVPGGWLYITQAWITGDLDDVIRVSVATTFVPDSSQHKVE